MAGITTDVRITYNLSICQILTMFPRVCTTFLALFLIEEDYTVCANHEASGAASRRIADEANAR
ncbi:hypothetical protein DFJ43DRAFT_1104955, partial [Lentinula guzmanii]